MIFLSDMLNKKLHLPKAGEALPGRAAAIPTASRHAVFKRAPAVVKRRALIHRKAVRDAGGHATALDGVDGDDGLVHESLCIKTRIGPYGTCMVSYQTYSISGSRHSWRARASSGLAVPPPATLSTWV